MRLVDDASTVRCSILTSQELLRHQDRILRNAVYYFY